MSSLFSAAFISIMRSYDQHVNARRCRCKNCVPMPTAVESVCCRDLDEIHTDHRCITMEPHFHILCLDIVVLRVAHMDVRHNGEADGIEEEHK